MVAAHRRPPTGVQVKFGVRRSTNAAMPSAASPRGGDCPAPPLLDRRVDPPSAASASTISLLAIWVSNDRSLAISSAELAETVVELRWVVHLVDEADAQRPVDIDQLGGEEQMLRRRRADQPHDACRRRSRVDDAEPGGRDPESARRVGEPEIAGDRDLGSATDTGARDDGDARLRESRPTPRRPLRWPGDRPRRRHRSCSAMSAPAQKWSPTPRTTSRRTVSSAARRSLCAAMPFHMS